MDGLYIKDGAAYAIYYFYQPGADTYAAAANSLAEQLDGISGGWGDGKPHCEPGQHDYQYKGLQPSPTASGVFALYVCSKCGDGILE